MKLRIADRILVAVAGILLLACCAGIVAQMFFNADLIGLATKAFSSESLRTRAILIGAAVLLLLLGLYCVLVLFRHRKRRDRFVLQKNEGGEIAISVKALENMVQKCLEQHEELSVQSTHLENRKDGLLIRLRGTVAGGVSIPLTVEALQKQIRQYVTACSGVEIKGIRVQIDASGEDAKNAPFAIAAPSPRPLLHEAEEKQTQVRNDEEKPEILTENAGAAAAVPTEPINPPAPEDDDDDRPLHQRLFSPKKEPCIVPEPPADKQEEEPEELQAADSTETESAADQETETDAGEKDGEPDSADSDFPPESGDELTEAGNAENDEELSGADPGYLESLKAFDQIVTGEKKEEE